MRRALAMSLLLVAMVVDAMAGTYYVAANGTANTDGSQDKPWPSVEFALTMRGGGHTIVVLPGVYRGPITMRRTCAGSAERPTVVRSEEKWKAVVIGAPDTVLVVAEDCDWVVIDGFEVLGGRGFGVALGGDHNTLRNCWIHHNTRSGVYSQHRSYGRFENNLVEFNGCHVQFDHGFYVGGSHHIFRGNIVRHNAGLGLHLSPDVSDSLVTHNLVYGVSIHPGTLLECGKGRPSRVVQNTFFGATSALSIWNGRGEVIANNIFVGGSDPIAINEGTRMMADYNLCWPKSKHGGPHGVVAEPQLFDVRRGLFWLTAKSPAIGKGSPQYTVPTDFWGRPVDTSKRPDLGAFDYVPSLIEPGSVAGWRDVWAYGYPPIGKTEAPDFWKLPRLLPTSRAGKTSPANTNAK